jgi:hypothetical protein
MGANEKTELVSLKEYIEVRLLAIEKTMEATDKSMALRLESMNELRDQIAHERGQYLLRTEHEAIHKALDADIRTLRESRAEISGKASITGLYFTALCVVASLLIAVAALVRSFF